MTCVCRARCNTSVSCPAFRCSKSGSRIVLIQAPELVLSYQSAWPVINWALRFQSVTSRASLCCMHMTCRSPCAFARQRRGTACRCAREYTLLPAVVSEHEATYDSQRVGGTSLAGLCELNCTHICGAHHDARICMHDVRPGPSGGSQRKLREELREAALLVGARVRQQQRAIGQVQGLPEVLARPSHSVRRSTALTLAPLTGCL